MLIIPLLILQSFQARRGPGPASWHRAHVQGVAWGRFTCVLAGAKVTVEDRSGLDPDQTVLIVSNHQGDFDIPLLLGYSGRPLAFVAKKELENLPLISRWMRLLGCIFLDREDRRRQVAQLRQTVDQLQQGLSMVIFPEGTRSRGPEMRPFAKGSLNLAEKAGVHIQPITLVDTYKLWPKGRKTMPGAEVKLILHPAINPSDLTREEKSTLHKHVQHIVQRGLESG
jgi:1-acyl-sn-glycerol-3-phosphate acyltransferase